jgi:hypothetical protein
MTWSLEAANSLRDSWGIGGADNALDIFTEGLDDPKFDPNKPYLGKRTPEEDIVEATAKEMAAEIDSEILNSLKGQLGA